MKTVDKAAYGDFQTPPALADAVCAGLAARGLRPASIVEPTCGVGNFLAAAGRSFPVARLLGVEIDPSRASSAEHALRDAGVEARVKQGDFFATDWAAQLAELPGPRLVLGNPPWVTSAELGALGVENLPAKSNFKRHAGLAAKTGKGNFDISEWMLLHLLSIGQQQPLRLAMLIKTAVARRVIEHAHQEGWRLDELSIRRIDARKHFGAAVDAALFCCSTETAGSLACAVYPQLDATEPDATIGFCDGVLVSDTQAYARAAAALGRAPRPWRSGIKHDCARVMELRRDGDGLVNGLGQRVELEAEAVFPLLKSSDLKGADRPSARRWLVLVQRRFGEDPSHAAESAPRAWRYLLEHADALDARRSSIYRTQPRFAVFGLGPYSFAPWKVAISGLGKRPAFTLVGPDDLGRPTQLDDTCYFLGFDDEPQARRALRGLRSASVRALLRALVFEDAKRPITKDVLDRIDWEAALSAREP